MGQEAACLSPRSRKIVHDSYNRVMDFSYLLHHHTLNPDRLEKEGFCKENEVYRIRKTFSDPNFYAILVFGENRFEVKVYETSFNEEYIPFTLKSVQTPLVAGLREQVQAWVSDLLAKAFDQHSFQERLLDYAQTKFHSPIEHPFHEEPYASTSVLRVKKGGKWYALFMEVKAKTILGKDEGELKVVNLKMDPKLLEESLDHIHFFPAYHMNKKYWITVLLDETTPWDKTKALLEGSYALVAKTK